MEKKQAFTLLEIMIVIFLIGLIGSVIGYNMKGSLDEGKAFKTEQAIARVHDLLLLEIAKGESAQEVADNPKAFLENSNIVKNAKDLLKDGWGQPLKISAKGTSDLSVTSAKLAEHMRKKHKGTKQLQEEAQQEEESNEEDKA